MVIPGGCVGCRRYGAGNDHFPPKAVSIQHRKVPQPPELLVGTSLFLSGWRALVRPLPMVLFSIPAIVLVAIRRVSTAGNDGE